MTESYYDIYKNHAPALERWFKEQMEADERYNTMIKIRGAIAMMKGIECPVGATECKHYQGRHCWQDGEPTTMNNWERCPTPQKIAPPEVKKPTLAEAICDFINDPERVFSSKINPSVRDEELIPIECAIEKFIPDVTTSKMRKDLREFGGQDAVGMILKNLKAGKYLE